METIEAQVALLADFLQIVMQRRLHKTCPQWKAFKLPQPRICIMEAKRSRSVGGWHSAQRWKQGAVNLHEIVLTPVSVSKGIFYSAGVIAHEIVHLTNSVAGIDDHSRQGRYHNDSFRQTAELMGLIVTKNKTRGWCDTQLGEELEEHVRDMISEGRLESHIFKYKRKPDASSKPSLVKVSASCGVFAYVTRAQSKMQSLRCGECGAILS